MAPAKGCSLPITIEGEGLEALFDRFLLRFELEYIGEDKNFLSMLQNDSAFIQPPEPLALSEIMQLQEFAAMVSIPEDILKTLILIRNDLKDEGIRPSDRRFRQSLSLIKAQAALSGRNTAQQTDLLILRNGLWEEVSQKSKTIEIVEYYSSDRCGSELERIENIAKELFNTVKSNPTTEIGMEASTKLKACLNDLAILTGKYPERASDIDVMKSKIMVAQNQIGQAILGL